jgi:hypothetical protein
LAAARVDVRTRLFGRDSGILRAGHPRTLAHRQESARAGGAREAEIGASYTFY